ncbi:MAG: 50S ribosomal protein L18 [Phycisphaerae bacterium]|nr:50S ribosomal protein L18 [Phycisphaerae bacterium]
MDKQIHKTVRRTRRRKRIRGAGVMGTTQRPRLSIYKSLNHMYAQVVDDLNGKTLAAASTAEKGLAAGKTGNALAAAAVGAKIAERAASKGVTAVVFDRGGFRFHGRVKALADAARKGGLKF